LQQIVVCTVILSLLVIGVDANLCKISYLSILEDLLSEKCLATRLSLR